MEKKSQVSKVTEGNHWSRHSNGIVKDFDRKYVIIINEDGNEWQISREILENEFIFADQFNSEVKVTKTNLSEILLNHPRMVMTVNYNKQVKEKDLNESFFKLYANKGGKIISETDYNKRVKALTKIALKGEERTIIGRHSGYLEENFGRLPFIDVTLENTNKNNPKKDYDTRLRLVDPRTLNWAIINNVKYTVK